MPSAPTSLTVTIPNCTTRQLSWAAPSDAVSDNLMIRSPVNYALPEPVTVYPDSSIEPYVIDLVAGQTYVWVGGANEETVTINDELLDGGETYTFVDTVGYIHVGYVPLEPVTATLKRASEVAAYRIYRDGVLVQEVGPNVLSFTDTVEEAPHVYSVSAVDSAGGESAVATWNSAAWQKYLGGVGAEQLKAVAIDSEDNVIVGGEFTGTLDLGDGVTLQSDVAVLFVAKFSSAGVCQWARKFTRSAKSVQIQGVNAITCDPDDNIFIGGVMGYVASQGGGIINCGGSDLTISRIGSIFLVKLDSAGTHQWSTSFLKPENAGSSVPPLARGIASDSDGNVFICGSFHDQISFDGVNYAGERFAGSFYYAAKFSSSGVFQWQRSWGGAGNRCDGVMVDGNDDVIAVITMSGAIDVGGVVVSGDNGFDIVLVKWDTDGNHIWSRLQGPDWPLACTANAAALDPDGDIVVVGGMVLNGTHVGGDPLRVEGSYGDAWVAKYSGVDGAHLWSWSMGSLAADQALDVISDPDGNVILCGTFTAPFTVRRLNNRDDEEVLPQNYSTDGFITKADADGNVVWAEPIFGTDLAGGRGEIDRVEAVAVDSDGFVIAVGISNSPKMQLGRQTFLNPSGALQAFIYKRPPCP